MANLIAAERQYFGELNRRTGTPIDSALALNQAYYIELFTLYRSTKDNEERLELCLELESLIVQAKALRDIQLNLGENV